MYSFNIVVVVSLLVAAMQECQAFQSMHIVDRRQSTQKHVVSTSKSSGQKSGKSSLFAVVVSEDLDTIVIPANLDASTVIPQEGNELKKKAPTASDWKRRLNTKQDSFNAHKWAGLGWCLSSAAIVGVGASTGFNHVPDYLEPFTYLFIASTTVQSMSAIPLAFKSRKNKKEALAKNGFISSAISCAGNAFVGLWLSPFAENFGHQDMAAAVIGFSVLVDAIYKLVSFDDLRQFHNLMEDAPDMNTKLSGFFKMFVTVVGLPLNVLFLQQMVGHEDIREHFVSTIAGNGSSPDLVFYATMITSMAIAFGNFTATLIHRKLITKEQQDVAIALAGIIALVSNVKAAGMI